MKRCSKPSNANRLSRCLAAGGCFLLAWIGMLSVGAQPAPVARPGPRTTPVSLADYAEVRYVAASTGSDSAEGTARKPWASLQNVLRRIQGAEPTRRVAVLVAAGVYGGGTVAMKPHVDLFGGFEAAGWTREISVNRTVLDGGDSRRVVVGSDHARLDGFEIIRGRERGSGAGLLCDGVSPTLTNNVFSANRALGPSPWNPDQLHEPANDGGAVACINGASPVIEHNLFAENATEIGRGGALSCNRNSSPRIAFNVFVENESGMIDPKRSSDGGAISIFDRSHPQIVRNLVVRNRALTSNDSGGIFVALWSSPLIEGNTIVGNRGGDDGGGLFIGGQEHRYGQPLDPMPPAALFRPRVIGNLIVGNEQVGGRSGRGNSGAMRITMESRALLENNIIAENTGGVYLQRSELVLRNNTILDPVLVVEEKAGLAPLVLVNSIVRGKLDIRTRASVRYCNLGDPLAGDGNFTGDPGLMDDGLAGEAVLRARKAAGFVSVLSVAGGRLKPGSLSGRPIRIGTDWTVVRENGAGNLEVWGRPLKEEKPGFPSGFVVPPTYRLATGSQCVDRGTNDDAPAVDFDGDARPLRGKRSRTVDVGADEHNPSSPAG